MVGAPISFGGNKPVRASDDVADVGSVQLITFNIGESAYGVDIMVVQEIRVWSETTTLPNMPPSVRGVINLRGVIVPIFDMRDRFGQGVTEPTNKHVVIIVAVEDKTIGLLVDAVSDILTVAETDIRTVPEADAGPEYEFLRGLIGVNDLMVALIEPKRLFSADAIDVAGELSGVQLGAS